MSVPSLVLPDSGNPLTDRLEAAERMVRDYCEWHIAPVITQTLILDGSGATSLFIPSLRVLDVTECKIRGVDIDVTDLEWSADGFLRRAQGWPNRLRSVELTIEHGFASVPGIAEIVKEIASRAGSAVGGRTRESAGGVNITNALVAPGVSGGVVLMGHEKAALDRYRLFRRP